MASHPFDYPSTQSHSRSRFALARVLRSSPLHLSHPSPGPTPRIRVFSLLTSESGPWSSSAESTLFASNPLSSSLLPLAQPLPPTIPMIQPSFFHLLPQLPRRATFLGLFSGLCTSPHPNPPSLQDTSLYPLEPSYRLARATPESATVTCCPPRQIFPPKNPNFHPFPISNSSTPSFSVMYVQRISSKNYLEGFERGMRMREK